MSLTGHYRLALHPGADAPQFEEHVKTVLFDDSGVFQLTRVTSSFESTLLRLSAQPDDSALPSAQYVWQVVVQTVNDAPYSFDQNAARVQERVVDYATLISVESFVQV